MINLYKSSCHQLIIKDINSVTSNFKFKSLHYVYTIKKKREIQLFLTTQCKIKYIGLSGPLIFTINGPNKSSRRYIFMCSILEFVHFINQKKSLRIYWEIKGYNNLIQW